MQGAIRYAESIFVEFLRGRPEPFPALRDAVFYYLAQSQEFAFCALFDDGNDLHWRLPDEAIYRSGPAWRLVQCNLLDMIRTTYRRACLEMASPPMMLVPPTDEALRDELVNPGPIEYYRGEYVGMTFRDDLRLRRGRRPPTTYHGVPIREVDRIPPPPGAAGLNMETMRHAMEQMREASRLPPRYMYDRCRCPACSDPLRQRQRDRAQATTKSLTLLRQWLSPAQLAQYDKSRYFDVISNSGKRYQIRHGTQGNVLELNESGTTVVAALCFQPQGEAGGFPGDTMLAQKIMLENDEAAALKAANVNRSLPLPLPVEWVTAG